MFKYTAYGININSQIAIPFLDVIENSDSQQLTLIVELIDNLNFTIKNQINKGLGVDSEGNIILEIPKIAYYKITDDKIAIKAYGDTDSQTIVNFLVSAAIPYFLAKQGKIILRGCSFSRDGETANLLIGKSGVGKSTLLAALAKKDYKILADQFCVLSLSDDRVYVEPAFAYIKLWFQATKQLKIDNINLLKVRPKLKRFYWQAPFCNKKLVVKNVFKIRTQNLEKQNLPEKVNGVDKIGLIQNNTFADELASIDKKHKLEKAKITFKLASQASFLKILNIRAKTTIQDLVDLIENNLNEK
ncbi:serine/threonine protein kinase [Francisella opportunistica]|uniref:Serine/threonine protein kinase n=1 Tax=Francisella opportunistica TaxID=2016517 RepID=A0A345JRM0_9GAMM|nr:MULTISPECIES: serine/threonine protein kinase [Francisella]APC91701.1 Serine kinase of the HPr protein, regulates carbohydrate metabolism [Francisella sp. MA067296]AXH29966.1 serine/threonine protein kinase [Francisella opportunistica]AXH31612.1 serine/threonine protein kinase [Francisella opportunistica]